jgi:hypothetical protein
LDVLKNLKLTPDYIVGESFSELAAAYADGVLTAEEAVLSAYAIGSVLVEAKIPASKNGKQFTSPTNLKINTNIFYFYLQDPCYLLRTYQKYPNNCSPLYNP